VMICIMSNAGVICNTYYEVGGERGKRKMKEASCRKFP